jgi:hypothetical protein
VHSAQRRQEDPGSFTDDPLDKICALLGHEIVEEVIRLAVTDWDELRVAWLETRPGPSRG